MLTLHKETRQLPIYSLAVAKNGPKIHAVEDGQGRTSNGPGRLEAKKIRMQKLADLLARPAGLPIIDSTGLTGVFDFTLEWSPDQAPEGNLPSTFTALQKQLGLKREGGKGPVPTGN